MANAHTTRYLEDIIGSNKYIEPLKETEAELEKVNMERSLRLSDAKHVEKEKDALESGKTEAETYLHAENEITLKQNLLFQTYGHQCAQNMSEASEKYEAELDKKNAAQETLAAKEADIKTAESECVLPTVAILTYCLLLKAVCVFLNAVESTVLRRASILLACQCNEHVFLILTTVGPLIKLAILGTCLHMQTRLVAGMRRT